MLFDDSGRLRDRLPIWVPVAILALAVALAFIIIQARPRPQPAEPQTAITPEISVVKVTNTSTEPLVSTTGRVSSPHEIQLISRVSGLIESVSDNFRDGAAFAQGDLLAQVEEHDYRVALTQTEATLASALQLLATEQGQADQAKREWRDLGNAQANALFLREPQLNSAKANAEAARRNVEQAQVNLQRTRIVAPFDGVISARYADVGQFVTAGMPIADLHSTDRVQIKVSLTPNEISDLGWQARSKLNLEPMSAEVSYQIGRDTVTVEAVLRHISPLVDAMTQMTEVLIDLDESLFSKAPPSPGQFVEVQLVGEPIDKAVWLPRSALYEREQVLLANQNKLSIKAVNVVATADSRILVVGLNDGDLAVIDRPLWVIPGQEVTPVLAED